MRFPFQVCAFVVVLCALGDGHESQAKNRGNIFGGYPRSNSTRFKSLEPVAAQVMKKLQRELYPVLEDIIFDPEIPTECSSAFQKIMLGLQNFEFWAISFARSSGGLPSMLEGNTADLGNYDACLGSVAKNSQGENSFTGRYCTLLLNINNPLLDELLHNAAESQPRLLELFYNKLDDFVEFNIAQFLRIGVCVPSTCNGEDIEYTVRKLGGEYGIEPWVLACRAKSEDPPLSTFQLFIIYGLLLLISLCLLGSYVDARRSSQDKSEQHPMPGALEVVRSFSIQRSWNTVFNFEVKEHDKYLACVHGLRALSAIYILWFHIYSVIDSTAILNAMRIAEWARYDVSFLPIYMGAHGVETFFCLSGAMAFRAFYKEFLRGKKTIFRMIYSDLIRRWIRLAIPSVALIALYNMVFVITSGPTKDFAQPYFWGKCEQNWWTIPTMLSNTKTAEDSCLLHLWYVGVDFQMRILFLIPLMLMASNTKYGALGFSLAGAMSIISVIFVSVTTFHNKVVPTGMPSPRFIPKLLGLYNYVQSVPVAHFGSFASGVCTMYIIEEQRAGRMKKFPKLIIFLLSLLALISGFINFFLPFYWQQGGDPWNAKSAFYAGLSRLIWSGGVAWIIYVCSMGYGGPINSILAVRALVPVSRLSFAFYLIHIFVVEIKVLHQRGLHEAGHYLQTVTALGSIAVSLFCAFVFFCLIENPVNNLVNLFCGEPRGSTPHEVGPTNEKKPPEVKTQQREMQPEKCYL